MIRDDKLHKETDNSNAKILSKKLDICTKSTVHQNVYQRRILLQKDVVFHMQNIKPHWKILQALSASYDQWNPEQVPSLLIIYTDFKLDKNIQQKYRCSSIQ